MENVVRGICGIYSSIAVLLTAYIPTCGPPCSRETTGQVVYTGTQVQCMRAHVQLYYVGSRLPKRAELYHIAQWS